MLRSAARSIGVAALLILYGTFLHGISHAAVLQLMSVKESAPGVVTTTVGVRAGVTPNTADFQLLLDGKNEVKATEVKPASSSLLETSVILCIDQSGSMGRSGVKQIQDALKGALEGSPSKPGGEERLELALWAFDTDVTKLHGFSEDVEELTKAAGRIGLRSTRDSQTKLYEAIELGLSELRNYPKKGPKRLILVTDGKDDGSSITEQVVVNEANAQSVVIDAIGFGNVSEHDSNLLARLATSTGGYFIRATGSEQLSHELRKLLSLPPPRVFDVNFHYNASASASRINTAQLRYAAAGQSPVLLNIQQALSAPRLEPAGPSSLPSPSPEKKSDLSFLLWIIVGLLVIAGIYLISRKKTPTQTEAPQKAEPQLAPSGESEPLPVKRGRTMVSFMFPPPGKGQPAAYLDGITGKARGERFPIEQKITHIGAGDDNELRVDDEYVSRKHAAIRYDSGNLYLSDSGSRNKTFLNDAELHQTAMALAPGDQIRVGKTTFQVRAPDDRAPQPHPQDRGKGPVAETIVP